MLLRRTDTTVPPPVATKRSVLRRRGLRMCSPNHKILLDFFFLGQIQTRAAAARVLRWLAAARLAFQIGSLGGDCPMPRVRPPPAFAHDISHIAAFSTKALHTRSHFARRRLSSTLSSPPPLPTLNPQTPSTTTTHYHLPPPSSLLTNSLLYPSPLCILAPSSPPPVANPIPLFPRFLSDYPSPPARFHCSVHPYLVALLPPSTSAFPPHPPLPLLLPSS